MHCFLCAKRKGIVRASEVNAKFSLKDQCVGFRGIYGWKWNITMEYNIHNDVFISV